VGFSIEKALGDASGNDTIPVGQLLNYAVGATGQANPIPSSPLDFKDFFSKGGKVFGTLGEDLSGIEDIFVKIFKELTDATKTDFDEVYQGFVHKLVAKAIQGVLKGVKDATDAFDTPTATAIGKALSDLSESITAFIGKFSDDVWNGFSQAYTDLVKVLKNFFDALLKFLLSEIQKFENLPGPLQCGPVDALLAVGHTVKLLLQVDANAQINLEARVTAVADSLQQLFLLAVGSTSVKDSSILLQVFDKLHDILIAIIRGVKPADLWTNFVLQDLIFSKDVVLGLVDAITKKQLWFWLNLPCGLHTGQLNLWALLPTEWVENCL
jgi:hypothetical protein